MGPPQTSRLARFISLASTIAMIAGILARFTAKFLQIGVGGFLSITVTEVCPDTLLPQPSETV